MRSIVIENLAKNVLLLLALWITYPLVSNHFQDTHLADEKIVVGNLLIGISMISVIACFGNFAFTYEKIGKNFFDRLVAHTTTGLLMFIIGISLEMASVLLSYLVGQWLLMNIVLIVLYLASILYDFWDVLKIR